MGYNPLGRVGHERLALGKGPFLQQQATVAAVKYHTNTIHPLTLEQRCGAKERDLAVSPVRTVQDVTRLTQGRRSCQK